nr:MAG TPA: hypothetical protein [Caudoviricetes sp.]
MYSFKREVGRNGLVFQDSPCVVVLKSVLLLPLMICRLS